jgi:isoleucyl-tRNA synthetase
MRANLPKREPEIQRFWEENDINRLVNEATKGKPLFILHDGPPYANGDIHIGTALNKVLKDMIIKVASMDGYHSPYVPGWDTHGLPIELRAIKEMGIDRRRVSPIELRDRCREYALKYVGIQREQFKRLGVRGDWDNPYLTLVPEYEAKQIEVFGEMVKRGYIYKGLKPVYWCTDCETALAEAEVEYQERRSPSIYVSFPVVDGKGLLDADVSFVIWTTTPWTIPANLAIAVHAEVDYQLIETEGGKFVMARELVEDAIDDIGWEDFQVLAKFKGRDLEGIICRHPLYDRASVVVLADHVTLEQGTGCVHIAPGHGHEDYETGMQYGLEILNPIDDKGVFTDEAPGFAGLSYQEANKAITKALQEAGRLLHLGFLSHQYPCCWRCKEPVIYRATEQWFASVKGFRAQALQAVRNVKWTPPWGEERMYNMVKERNDWCISRQRLWGVPIPIFYCQSCGETLVNDDTIRAVAELFRREGSNAWFKYEAEEILPPGTVCPRCQEKSFRKETDIMDVWFDSGSSHAAVLETRPELSWPAEMYLEGSDQHRGWFQSSLLTSVATRGRAPYNQVLTHGFVVDGEGRKMSKSMGNVIDPQKVIAQYGADILRLWVASADYRGDIRVSPEILKQMSEVYRKIRNTFRFLLGNLQRFDPERHAVPVKDMNELDRWALNELQKLIKRVRRAYWNYEYHLVYYAIHNFCTVDMSAFYLDVLKDRLYCSWEDAPERRAAQTVLFEVLSALVRLAAPVLTHTCEEVWQHMPHRPGDPISVQLSQFPPVNPEYVDDELAQRWKRLLAVRVDVSKALELARARKEIGTSLEAQVILSPGDEETASLLQAYLAYLPTVLIVSSVQLLAPGTKCEAVPGEESGVAVVVAPAPGNKCARCWTYSEEVADKGLCNRCASIV